MILIKDIVTQLPILQLKGSQEQKISEVVQLEVTIKSNEKLFWCSDKNRQLITELEYGTVIISIESYRKLAGQLNNFKGNFLVVEFPRFYFLQVLNTFFVEKEENSISKTATIHESAVLGDNLFVGENVVIEKNVSIGDNVTIDHNTIIKSKTIINNNVRIGANCTIGGVGFGYEKDLSGRNLLIPHIGNVVLDNDVEVGNNTCIDRAVLGSTKIGENTKVDNLVHIAHGVKVGNNSMIIANAMIAGSVIIGKNVWISPSSSIIQKKNIGTNSVVGLGSVVLKDVEKNSVVAGVPAKKLK